MWELQKSSKLNFKCNLSINKDLKSLLPDFIVCECLVCFNALEIK